MDYLFNVWVSLSPYAAVFFGIMLIDIFILSRRNFFTDAVNQETLHKVRRGAKFLAACFMGFGIAYSFVSPSNTPKNELNVPSRSMTIEQKELSVEDKTRKPKQTDSERKSSFDSLVDYKK